MTIMRGMVFRSFLHLQKRLLFSSMAVLFLFACGDSVTRWSVDRVAPTFSPGPGEMGEDDPEPLSVTWSITQALIATPPRWRSGPRDRWSDVEEGSATLSGRESVSLTGPHGEVVHPEVHHVLVVRARTTTANVLTVEWRDQGQGFAPERRTSPFSLVADGEWQTYSLPLSEMRGIRDASDAEDGVELFRLRFSAQRGGEVSVDVASVALVSHFDDPKGRGFTEGRLRREGVYREGVALRVPGQVGISVPSGEGALLAFGLAVTGTDRSVEVEIDDGLSQKTVVCSPQEGWQEVRFPLDGDQDVVLSAKDGGDGRAVVLVGSVMRLVPDTRNLPDVFLYVEDTLRADRLGTYGYPQPTDPNLQSLGDQGAVFERVFAPSNWTRPSVASLLTGLYPPTHGNLTHRDKVAEGYTTLAEHLAVEGYLTVSLVSNYHAGAWAGLDQGVDIHHEPPAFGLPLPANTLTSGRMHGPLKELLGQLEGVRLFVVVHSLDPHVPYEPPAEDLLALSLAAKDRPRPRGTDPARAASLGIDYDGEILHNDRWLGRLDAVLEASGRKEALVMFTSDHGEAFGEHGHWEHHGFLYQEEVSVPWVVRWPGKVAPGQRLDAPASLVDIAPTLSGLLGIAPRAEWQGNNFSSRLLGHDEGEVADRVLFIDAVATEDHPRPGHEMAALWWPYKLILREEEGAVVPAEMFALDHDPWEERNLLGEESQERRVEELTRRVQALLDEGRLFETGGEAQTMNPALREWMRQMGYLR